MASCVELSALLTDADLISFTPSAMKLLASWFVALVGAPGNLKAAAPSADRFDLVTRVDIQGV
jgi:hypothetical protein